MVSYTLKKQENEDYCLLNEDGNIVSFNDIMTRVGEQRVIAFYGGMGKGKTTLIKSICKELGVTDAVNSPTFAIVNVYDLPTTDNKNIIGNDAHTIYHFDCYRLKNIIEAIDLGAEEYIYSGQYCFIEWPEIIESILPPKIATITIELLPEGDRKIILEGE